MAFQAGAEHFPHGADIGVRGIGHTKEQAFEQVALALTEIVTEVTSILPREVVEMDCAAPSDGVLLADWLNRVIYEMAVRHMVFGRFEVTTENGHLRGRAWGEKIDQARHTPAVGSMCDGASEVRFWMSADCLVSRRPVCAAVTMPPLRCRHSTLRILPPLSD
ncbi:MAG: archease [Stellaceae bacterium]